MSRHSEKEIQAIIEDYKDTPTVNPHKAYPTLPSAGNIMPLVRMPAQMAFTEEINGTEYTVNAYFRKDGRDLLGILGRILNRNVSAYGFDYEDNADEE